LTQAFVRSLTHLELSKVTTALFTHDVCELHEISPGHPEQPARIKAVLDQLRDEQLFDRLDHQEAPLAVLDHLARAHGNAYVDHIVESAPESGSTQLDPDTAMNPYSLDASRRAAGAGVEAVKQVVEGRYKNAFCAVRPPGHHAEKEKAMGFCFFGSVAVAAFHALDELGLNRVAIVDFDVHHGNGTEDLVVGDKRIMFCSSFQHPFYPGYYRQSVPGHLVNVPLSAGTGSQKFREAISSQWVPELEAFAPELVIISAGFDAHQEDPLASLELGDDDFEWVTREIATVADKHAGGRIVSMLEGGYSLPALGRSAARHTSVLLEL